MEPRFAFGAMTMALKSCGWTPNRRLRPSLQPFRRTLSIGHQDVSRALVVTVHDAAHFFIDRLRDLFRVIAVFHHVSSEEWVTVTPSKSERTEPLAHAVLADHRTSHLRCAVEVVGRASGD